MLKFGPTNSGDGQARSNFGGSRDGVRRKDDFEFGEAQEQRKKQVFLGFPGAAQHEYGSKIREGLHPSWGWALPDLIKAAVAGKLSIGIAGAGPTLKTFGGLVKHMGCPCPHGAFQGVPGPETGSSGFHLGKSHRVGDAYAAQFRGHHRPEVVLHEEDLLRLGTR